jgi:hypothetical protein
MPHLEDCHSIAISAACQARDDGHQLQQGITCQCCALGMALVLLA